MEKKSKKSIRPTLIVITVLGLIAASSAIFYNTGMGNKNASVAKGKEAVIEEKKVISYLDLNLNAEGLLKDQVLDLEGSSPNVPNYKSQVNFSNATPIREIVLQKEFLSLLNQTSSRRNPFFADRYTPLTVDVFGEIGKVPLIGSSSKLQHVRFNAKSVATPFIVTFTTRLNHETGKVFWHRVKKSSGKENIDLLAAGLLKSLQFTKDHSNYVSSGEISLVISLERGVNFHKQLSEKLSGLEAISFNSKIKDGLAPSAAR